jgi:hypothetical protein
MESGRYAVWELTLKTLTLVGLVLGACWAFFTYMDTKEKEFYTTFWNKKLELFLEVSSAASTMATTTSAEEFNKARSKYLELFHGRLSLVEGQAVKDAMIAFSAFVLKRPLNESDLPQTAMQQPAYQLTLALKEELGRAWQKPFEEL